MLSNMGNRLESFNKEQVTPREQQQSRQRYLTPGRFRPDTGKFCYVRCDNES